jgi:2-alkyl-3-oxoalkanoate reductase
VRVFVTGASGAIGEPPIAELLKRGHFVMGMATSETGAKVLEGQGASERPAQRLSVTDLSARINHARLITRVAYSTVDHARGLFNRR